MGFFDWFKGKSRDDEPKQPARGQPAPNAPSGGLRVGELVLASWLDSYFYPGRIRQIQGNSCEIAFEDGDAAWVHQANVRQPDIKPGSKVFCRIHGGPVYLPGTVQQCNGDKIHVHYDNGEKEWTTISMIRVKRPLANVGPPAQLHGPGTPAAGPTGMGGGMGGAMTGVMTASGAMAGTPLPPFIADVGEPVDDSTWRVGDRALGRWFDFFWYPATILAIGAKGYHLLFDDGDQRIVSDLWLMALDLEEGEELFIRPKKEPQRIYLPARILRVRGEVIDVELEDGTQETNQKVSRARFWRCPVGVRQLDVEESDRVWAKDIDGFTYPAEVLAIDNDKIVVQFLDGPERMLTPELIKPFSVQAGLAVQCRWKAGQTYFSGKITQIEGDRIHIAYDDGDEESTTIRLVRLVPKDLGIVG